MSLLWRARLRPILPKRLQLASFSPFVRSEYRFSAFPKQPGKRGTLAFIVGVNTAVWASWQISFHKALAGDESMYDFMHRHFMGSNKNTSEISNLHKIPLVSFSHQDFGHLSANMFALLMLAPKLHDFLGRARFMALYFAGSLGGTLATQAAHLDPYWEEKAVAESPERYRNILSGREAGDAAGLGASNSIAALFACFYFTFPRQPVPFLFSKFNIAWSLLPKRFREQMPTVGRFLRRTKAAAIWVLPAFFFVDFVEIWRRLVGQQEDRVGLLVDSNVGHAAHVGGFLSGTAFYVFVAHPLKGQLFHFTRHEMFRRAYIMSLSLSFWYAVTALPLQFQEKPGARKVTFWLATEGPNENGSMLVSNNSPTKLDHTLAQLWKTDPRLSQMVEAANHCVLQESCGSSPNVGESGDCDGHFHRLHQYLSRNSTAPKQAAELLSPVFVDSIRSCREVLRQLPAALHVHEEYYTVHPQINDVTIPASLRSFGHVVRRFFRVPGDPLEALGLIIEEGTHNVYLAGVIKDSPADKANAAAHQGKLITHVCNKPVKTRSDVIEAMRQQLEIHVWLECTSDGKQASSSKYKLEKSVSITAAMASTRGHRLERN